MDSILTVTPSISSVTSFITAYGPKLKVTLDCPPGTGRTKQSFKDDSDINNIMARYVRTGTLDFVNKHAGRYGDVTGADFASAVNVIAEANSMFADMPAQLRARFRNDPRVFLDFIQNEGNREEAVELGLLKPEAREASPLAPQEAQTAVAAQGVQNRGADGRFETGREAPEAPKTNSTT